MSNFVFLLILLGAFLHAAWNTSIKLSPDKPLETAFMNLSGSFLVLPGLLIYGVPEVSVWPYLLATLALHIVYYYSLSGAYRWGDMSLTYPVMRGFAPLLLIVLSSIFSSDRLHFVVIVGIVLVCLGIVFLGVVRQSQQNILKAISYALLNACVIALYTMVDGLGVREVKEPFSYIAMFMFLDGFIYSLLLFHKRAWPIRELSNYCVKRWCYFVPGAVATITSYGIALWAMSVAPIGMVSALREVSVLFALLIAYFLLKEEINGYRWIGIFLIGSGAVLIKLS